MEGRGREGGDGMDDEAREGMGKGEIGPPTFWLLPPPMVEVLGRIISRGPYPHLNAIIYMHLRL